jgi:hypothetical protein
MELQMLTENSIYRVLSTQIIDFWDAIKFACKEADELRLEDMQNYFNSLLQELLSDKAQCFVVLDDNRILHSVVITKIVINKAQNIKELNIQCLYSMTTISNSSALRYFKFIADFAKQENCSLVTYNSKNPRVWDIAKTVGCVERYRSFSYNLGGI